jgi:hypothetical protein
MTTKNNTPNQDPTAAKPEAAQIPIDGFNQILEMLRVADPAFRESLLKRLASKDRTLAQELRRDLGI